MSQKDHVSDNEDKSDLYDSSEDYRAGYSQGYKDAWREHQSEMSELAQRAAVSDKMSLRLKTVLQIADLSHDPSLTVDELYHSVWDTLSRAIDTSNFYIARVNHAEQTLSFDFFKDSFDLKFESPKDFPVRPIGKGFTELLLEKRHVVLLDDKQMKALCDRGERETRRNIAKSWLGAPLISGSRVLGAMVIQDYNDEHKFSNSDKALFSFASQHIADAIARYERKIEAQKEHEALRSAAKYDGLTGLHNRSSCYDTVKTLMADRRKNFSMLFIDLDGFKHVNDTFGHAIGDDLLIEVAQTMKEVVRDSDIVCRLGGDEFVILLPRAAGASAAIDIAERLLVSFAQEFQLQGHTVKVGTSIGIVPRAATYSSVEAIVSAADAAMYKAKKQGKHQYTIAG